MSDLVAAILDEAVSVTWKVRAAGSYNATGDWTPGAETAETIQAAIQPPSGRDLQDAPEGIRQEIQFMGWTPEEVEADDVIAFGGTDYRVIHAWPRRHDGGFTKFAMKAAE